MHKIDVVPHAVHKLLSHSCTMIGLRESIVILQAYETFSLSEVEIVGPRTCLLLALTLSSNRLKENSSARARAALQTPPVAVLAPTSPRECHNGHSESAQLEG